MRYANIYIYIFVLHRSFFQQPRPRVGIAKLGCNTPNLTKEKVFRNEQK